MRTPVPLALLLLAACASPGTPGVDPEWNEIQQRRFERLREPRHPSAAVIALLGRAPRDLTQEPKPASVQRDKPHLDQMLPAAVGVGPRPFVTPLQPLIVRAEVGLGNVAASSKHSLLDDRTKASFVRVGVDAGTGAAVHAEAWTSDNDLFAGTMINDGVAPASASATLRGVEVFPHMRFDAVEDGRFSMPIRAGLYADWQTVDHARASVEREWLSLGPRIVFEPTWRLFGDEHARLDVVGRIGGEVGPTWFSEAYRGGDDRDVTSRWSGDIGASLRGHAGRLQAELGYGLHHTVIGHTETDLFGSHSRTELQRQQAFFGLGIRF